MRWIIEEHTNANDYTSSEYVENKQKQKQQNETSNSNISLIRQWKRNFATVYMHTHKL